MKARGATVFVADAVAPLLDDKTLDAQTQGDQVTFTFVGGAEGDPGGWHARVTSSTS